MDYCLKPINPDVMIKQLEGLRTRLISNHRPNELESKGDDELTADILRYVRENYSKKLELADLAKRFNFNKNYLCVLFKRSAGTTFTTYLTGLRIDAAKKLLTNSNLSQNEIAAKTGFSDGYYFNKVFKAECGVTPLQYRRSSIEQGC
jgi:YesN/AraC family two-component response regulator